MSRNIGYSGACAIRRTTTPSQPMTVSPSPQITVHVCGCVASSGTVTSAMSVTSDGS